ncbi:NAD(P)H-hydrate dehydratase [Maritimibacter sp. DP1N21-5]|uniref:NAD(P)H-hydrate dehydratase n=1 Tax=Maritimibacter sp. DP1N21-5 TaxID=2836867 RepID=UPI001C46F5AF|nr:NAD(P)H-hydrate dehydratase [Maritimibacter sp. DP1N21-5]MBV7410009.1 NAD(P)H-hydrate dehydratase [Maritimibacter sp. DP1N21-5]
MFEAASCLLSAAEMRAIEVKEIASGRVTGAGLMEAAGEGVVQAVFERWPYLATRAGRATILCGPGNNGGDGYVVARLLAQRGWHCEVQAMGGAGSLPPDARANRARWEALGPVRRIGESGTDLAPACDILVDALFGIGLARPLDPALVPERGAQGPCVVAVDLPSGICSDSGRVLGDRAVKADLTVTFHAPKLGHCLADGPAHCGELRVVDIGLASPPPQDAAALVGRPDPGVLAKRPEAHKYGYGHALVLAGGVGKGGAARMAARAALRAGAGLVTLAPTPGALQENAARLDAVMLAPVDGPEVLTERLRDSRLNALCLGPGLGVERAEALLSPALNARRPVVLDADALTALAKSDPDRLHPEVVLTPHGGEFARLFPDLAERLGRRADRGPAYSRVNAVRDAAQRAGCCVLLKGADTVIAEPSGRAAVHAAAYGRAAPWLATAGAGDVLAGVITGLLARGFTPWEAATTGTWLHVEAARAFGPGLIAEDLPDALSRVFRSLGL